MLFEQSLPVDTGAVLRMLGYGDTAPDDGTAQRLKHASIQLEQTAQPRWTYARFALEENRLKEPGLALAGRDIAAHLAGCTSCLLLGLTLGVGTERVTLAAEASDMALAVLLDAAASVLVEAYAAAAEQLLRQQAEERTEFLTTRFSPGYGDLPISLQNELVRLLDAPRAIGLSVSDSGILLPRKSITALLGLARVPVAGKLATCDSCALRGRCSQEKGGRKLCETF